MPSEKPQAGGEVGRRKVPRAVREEQMIESAIDVFSKRGYKGASMDEIAAGASISKPMLYSYFGSKENLLAACIERRLEPLAEAFGESVDKSLPPDEQLWAGIVSYFAFAEENKKWWSSVYLEAAATTGPPADAVKRVRERIVALIAELIAGEAEREGGLPLTLVAPNVEAVAWAFVGAAEALSAWWIEHPNEPRDLVAIRLMNFAWRGLEQLSVGRFWLPHSGRLGSTPG